MKALLVRLGLTERRDRKRKGNNKIRARITSWLAWSLWAFSVGVVALTVLLDLTTPTMSEMDEPAWVDLLLAVLALTYTTVGGLVASRRPDNSIGWIFCGVGLLIAFGLFFRAYAGYALLVGAGPVTIARYLAWLSVQLMGPVVALATVLLMLLFPNGRVPSGLLFPDGRQQSRSWWQVVIWMAVIGSTITALWLASEPDPYNIVFSANESDGTASTLSAVLERIGLFAIALLPLSFLFAGASLVSRLALAREQERQQLKWFAYAAAIMIGGLLVGVLLGSASNLMWWLGIVVGILGFMFFPVATAIGILRYRLYDIDRVINRTLVYSMLTACIVGLYVLVVGGAGALLQGSDNLLISLLATGLVALLFHPLRVRLQRSVNRLMYGQRDEPYAVLSRLGRRLEGTLAPEAALSTIVETVVQALKLPYAAIELNQDNGFKKVAEYGTPAGEPITLPLVHQGEEVGRLVVYPRASGETFAPSDRKLLDDLAWQAGTAARAVRLTADLQRSREKLVTAREEERRRLRRDLHDGVGPQLAALMLELETAGDLVSGNPQASALMAKLSERTRETVSDVRRSVHALRPPALDELGLVGALREVAAHYSQGNLRVSVEAPGELRPLPAAVEVACYRIAQEAMTNVVRHAEASNCWVRIRLDEETEALRVEVEDDGMGIREESRAGVGMSSMRERAEELGGTWSIETTSQGGTLVSATLPCRTADDGHEEE